ncbi:unnamed protein product, partial [Effrenium voratum]
VSTSRLVLEKMLAWKWLGTANPPMPVDSADLLVVLWVADGSEGDGLQLIRGEEEHLIRQRRNRVVLWRNDWRGILHSVKKEVRYEDQRVDLLLSFGASLGHKLYPGWTRSFAT